MMAAASLLFIKKWNSELVITADKLSVDQTNLIGQFDRPWGLESQKWICPIIMIGHLIFLVTGAALSQWESLSMDLINMVAIFPF